jgi:alanyl-tRNA synthetase
MESTLGGVAGTLRVTPHEVPARVGAMMDQVRELEKELNALKGRLASVQGDEMVEKAVDVGGVKVLSASLNGADAKALRDTMDKLKDKLKSAVIVLGTAQGDKVQLAAGVTSDLVGRVKAGELVSMVAQQVGGKGGGKPDMAMAGGTQPEALPQALDSVLAWVKDRL